MYGQTELRRRVDKFPYRTPARRTQKHGETVGEYNRGLRELYRRASPTWARTKDADGEEVLRTAFMGGLQAELQR